MRGQDAGQTLQQFVASNDGWNLVKDEVSNLCSMNTVSNLVVAAILV